MTKIITGCDLAHKPRVLCTAPVRLINFLSRTAAAPHIGHPVQHTAADRTLTERQDVMDTVQGTAC
jgi:hypothetical protein